MFEVMILGTLRSCILFQATVEGNALHDSLDLGDSLEVAEGERERERMRNRIMEGTKEIFSKFGDNQVLGVFVDGVCSAYHQSCHAVCK